MPYSDVSDMNFQLLINIGRFRFDGHVSNIPISLPFFTTIPIMFSIKKCLIVVLFKKYLLLVFLLLLDDKI